MQIVTWVHITRFLTFGPNLNENKNPNLIYILLDNNKKTKNKMPTQKGAGSSLSHSKKINRKQNRKNIYES